jgi:DNA-binding CsgD family transcriptional regulator
MGMDALLKSIFLKVSKGKAKLESLSPRQQEIYVLWNKGVSLREAAKRTAK